MGRSESCGYGSLRRDQAQKVSLGTIASSQPLRGVGSTAREGRSTKCPLCNVLTPRRAKSNWSRKNTEHAERLIAEERMQPPGLAHVEAARCEGRWEQAYSGSAKMVMPDDFLEELHDNNAAKKMFKTLDRRNLYVIYHRLQTAKRPETRMKRIKTILAHLASGKSFH